MNSSIPMRTVRGFTGDLPEERRPGEVWATRREGGAMARVLRILVSWLAGLVAAAIVAVALALTVVPAAAGGHTLTVLSGSMVPELPVGSVVIDRPAPANALRVGDIVTYSTSDPVTGAPILITHRIIAVHHGDTGLTFTTKGDANNVADQRPVAASQIRGRVWYSIPYIGTIRDVLLTKGTALMALAAVLLVAGSWTLYRIWRPKQQPADAVESERGPQS